MPDGVLLGKCGAAAVVAVAAQRGRGRRFDLQYPARVLACCGRFCEASLTGRCARRRNEMGRVIVTRPVCLCFSLALSQSRTGLGASLVLKSSPVPMLLSRQFTESDDMVVRS